MIQKGVNNVENNAVDMIYFIFSATILVFKLLFKLLRRHFVFENGRKLHATDLSLLAHCLGGGRDKSCPVLAESKDFVL